MKTLYAITFSLLFCWTLNIEDEQEYYFPEDYRKKKMAIEIARKYVKAETK